MFYVKGTSYLQAVEVANFTQVFASYKEAQEKAKQLNNDFPDMIVLVEFNHESINDKLDDFFPIKTSLSH